MYVILSSIVESMDLILHKNKNMKPLKKGMKPKTNERKDGKKNNVTS